MSNTIVFWTKCLKSLSLFTLNLFGKLERPLLFQMVISKLLHHRVYVTDLIQVVQHPLLLKLVSHYDVRIERDVLKILYTLKLTSTS